MKDVRGIPRVWIALLIGFILAAVLLAIALIQKRPAIEANPLQAHTAPSASGDITTGTGGISSAAEAARRAAIAAQGTVKHRGTNAADLYKQAAALYAQLTDDEKAILKHENKNVSPDESAALYAKLQPIMDLLRNARKADYTDWDMGSMTPMTNLMSRVQTERDLSTMALWESGYRFQNDPGGAVGDLDALESMGRNNVDSLLGLVLQDGIHSGIVNLLAQNTPSISGISGADLSDLLNGQSVAQYFQNGLDAEAAMQMVMMNDFNNPNTRSQSFVQTMLVKNGGSPPSNAEVQWLAQTEQAVGASLTEPDAQFNQWWSQQLAQANSMPLAGQFLPNLNNIRAKTQSVLVENAMLQVGVALEQNNQSALQSIPDPISGQPFTYTQTADGFQLGSTMQVNGKPVTLNFTTPTPAQ